jgi:hypothetical protein
MQEDARNDMNIKCMNDEFVVKPSSESHRSTAFLTIYGSQPNKSVVAQGSVLAPNGTSFGV